MSPADAAILTLNGGSSSIRFALYRVAMPSQRGLHGKLDRIGLPGATLTFGDQEGTSHTLDDIAVADHRSAVDFLLDWLDRQQRLASVVAVGHRVVYGINHTGPERITAELLDELRRIMSFDPEHLPCEITLIEALQQARPALPQVACFDTAFHHTLPRIARILPIPRRYEAQGIRRYGFHGLSYAWLMEELARLGDPAATTGRVILAHLGNGASMAAVRDGQCIDTSMGFTPASGLVMSSRSGDLDPGVASYLALTEHMDGKRYYAMANHESGLLGVSETSSDMRDLLALEADDIRAAEAVALFCYQAKKWIGAFAAVLGGLDTLVFAGGIGEHAPVIRSRICADMGFPGMVIDEQLNGANQGVISAARSAVRVRVINTNEESMIERSVRRVLDLGVAKEGRP